MRLKSMLLGSCAVLIAMTAPNVSRVAIAQAQSPSVARAEAQTQKTAARRAPNILVIMTDDVGFGASSTFGGLVDTPTFDKLAENGLRYNNFHTTALCSPTRAALLTGRNPHAVGMGNLVDSASEDAGYSSVIPKSAATAARVLRDNGYHTAVIGKYHLIPKWELTSVGSKEHWPTSMGFDHFYGFEPSFTDLFTPQLIENTTFIKSPAEPDYHLESDLADKAIQWLREVRTAGEGKPFFLYYAPPTAHAPLQAPQEWLEKYRGRFDGGWDAARREIFARQKKLGVVPRDAVLTERTEGIPAWDTLGADQKRLYARHMEVFAAALAFADFQIGRVLDELKAKGELDDTIVIYIQGDNGASFEGDRNGLVNYYNRFNGFTEDISSALDRVDELGGPATAPAIPLGWTNALGTPFQYWKGRADYFGAVRNGLVISWPKGIKAKDQLRTQFHSIQDIVPTIYDVVGVTPPEQVDGVQQQPITGISMAYTFESRRETSRRHKQYFETNGNISIYKDGWWANYKVAQGESLTPDLTSKSEWELYNLIDDFSQSKNVADASPAKLMEMKEAFRDEAVKNKVFPVSLFRKIGRRTIMNQPGRYFFYSGAEKYSDWGFPNIKRRSWSMTAEVDVPSEGGSGVIVNQGGRFAGWGLMFFSGVPKFIYKYNDSENGQIILDSGRKLGSGAHKIEISATYEAASSAASRTTGGTPVNGGLSFVMSIDGEVVTEGALDDSVRTYFQAQGAAIGKSTGSALTEDYEGEFNFNGEIRNVVIDVKPN